MSAPPAEPTMTFWEHLDELRRRLTRAAVAFFVGAMVAWSFREQVLSLLVRPFSESWIAEGIVGGPTLHFGTPAAAFFAYLKLSFLAGGALASPVIFYELWAFIAPGLYAREKKVVVPFVAASSLLFVFGGYFAWRAVFPVAFRYFLGLSGYSGQVAVVPTIMMGDYLDFVTQLLLVFGVMFEMPLLILFLSLVGIVNYLTLIRFGRWFVLLAFVVAAIATPPDAVSQVLMAVPMIVLYGVSILLAFLFGKRPTDEQRAAFKQRSSPR